MNSSDWLPITDFVLVMGILIFLVILATGFDVRVTRKATARKRHEERKTKQFAEARQSHSQKLESLGRLSAGVAHDFNNVLGVILTHAQLAQIASTQYEKYHVPGHEQIQHDLCVIEQAAEQAASFVKELLVFARVEEANPQPTLVREVVQSIDALLRGHLNEKVEFTTNWNKDEDPWPVFIDQGKLTQALLNLVLNANDAMPDGGCLRLSMHKYVHDGMKEINGAMPRGRYVKITVEDNGTGIKEEHVDHIFEPFYTSKPQGKGSGLGLATVYGIVTQANGYINVTTERGKGTRFDIYLPVVEVTQVT